VDFRYLDVNPAFEIMTGLRAEAVLGKRLLDALPTTEPHWIETYGRVVLTGEPYRFESFHAGLGRHFDVVAYRPRSGQCAVVFQDVTKRKEHEEQIERLNRLYAVLSQVNQAIVRAGSPDELFRSICHVAVTFGHFRLVWIGACDPETGAVTMRAKDTDERGFPYAIQANACGVVQSAIREGRPRICNVLTGSESDAECHAQAMQEDISSCAALPIISQGRACAALCLHAREPGFFNPAEVQLLEEVAQDVSFALDKLDQEARRRQAEEEARKAAEALRASEDRYRLISENTADVIWLMDTASGRLTYVSPSVERLLGYSPEVAMARGLPELLTPDSYQYAAARLAEVLAAYAAGEPFARTQTHQVDLLCKDGSMVRVEVVATLLTGEREQAPVILGVNRDITERLQVEARLAQAQKMESVGRLAGGVAHDFNNLLTVINGYTQMVLGELNPADPLREGLEEIRKAGERAAGLTAQLLAFSRKQVLQPRPLDLNRVAGAMEPMLARLVGEDVEVRVVLSAEECVVRADPHQLEQAIMNLAVNARDAMPRGGNLLIETAAVEWDPIHAQLHPGARSGRHVMLAVSDTGVGMDEATRSKIFEPFFTTKGVGKGTGLGLSTVQGIVAQSGGHIEVYSEPGSGTTFKIYLPRIAEAVVFEGAPEAASAPRGTETVLVVEDQTDVRDYTAAALQSYGYRVLKAGSAAEALSICAREGEHIDLVLTDVVMPNVGGLELAGLLAKLRPGMRILYMSGYTDNAIIQLGVPDEAAEFITKPFGPERLAAKVRAALGPR
jgi:PAS domain S-box-containing protein